ncbi:BBSome-interacting protein 1 [Onthophagus taurus]|uniref:BBSome-interacting protein 1 n=1 Tax=Onthophagus taurus TaxID=166361 RepID=UPI0039BE7E23
MSENDLKPIVPKTGQLLIENPEELVLCKPRLIPLKSYTLEKLEKMQKEAIKTLHEIKENQNN